jgi:hypothetical protein
MMGFDSDTDQPIVMILILSINKIEKRDLGRKLKEESSQAHMFSQRDIMMHIILKLRR